MEFGLWQDKWYGRCIGTLARDGTSQQGSYPFPSVLCVWYHHEGTCPQTHFQLHQSSGTETSHVVGQTRKWGPSRTHCRTRIVWSSYPSLVHIIIIIICFDSRFRNQWKYRGRETNTTSGMVLLKIMHALLYCSHVSLLLSAMETAITCWNMVHYGLFQHRNYHRKLL